MDKSIVAALLKSPVWLAFVILGVIAFIWAALPSSEVIAGAHIGLDGTWWHLGVAVIGLVLIGFAIFFSLINVGVIISRADKSQGELQRLQAELQRLQAVLQRLQAELQRLPIQTISINPVQQTAGAPNPHVRVSGAVTPTKKGVDVYLLRENLAGREAGKYSLSPGHATTNDNGYWEHPVALWGRGPFRIYAVVTTAEYKDLFHFYRHVFDALLIESRKQDPDTRSVPGWPNFEALPPQTHSVVNSRYIELDG